MIYDSIFNQIYPYIRKITAPPPPDTNPTVVDDDDDDSDRINYIFLGLIHSLVHGPYQKIGF